MKVQASIDMKNTQKPRIYQLCGLVFIDLGKNVNLTNLDSMYFGACVVMLGGLGLRRYGKIGKVAFGALGVRPN